MLDASRQRKRDTRIHQLFGCAYCAGVVHRISSAAGKVAEYAVGSATDQTPFTAFMGNRNAASLISGPWSLPSREELWAWCSSGSQETAKPEMLLLCLKFVMMASGEDACNKTISLATNPLL